MSRQALKDNLWRLIHPRLSAQRERIREEIHRLERENQEWLSVVNCPDATPNDLRSVAFKSQARRIDYDLVRGCDPLTEYTYISVVNFNAFKPVLCSHPNIPLDLFGNLFGMNGYVVEGLLKNPILPLLPLEKPDLFREDVLIQFGFHALQYVDIPPSIIRLLTAVKLPLMALEAKTHLAAATDEEKATPPDLAWLDRQVISLVQREPVERQSLLAEFEWHSSELRNIVVNREGGEMQSIDPDQVAACVQQAQSAVRGGKNRRQEWFSLWVQAPLLQNDAPFSTLYTHLLLLATALRHPDMPSVIRRELNNRTEPSLLRLLSLHNPEVSARHIRKSEQRALGDIWSYIWLSDSDFTSPGIVYLVSRSRKYGLHRIPRETRRFLIGTDFTHCHFLIRLAIALCLDDASPEHRNIRGKLQDDPNRYVRSAARKEIA